MNLTTNIEIIDENSSIIDIFLIKLIEDKVQEVKIYAKYCFILYK